MYKLEQNYVLGGRVSVNYIQFESYPYMSAFMIILRLQI